MTPHEQRLVVIEEARSWIGTPWHHRARVKGAGVDCIQFVVGVFAACGLCESIDTGYYGQDWMWHRNEELILNGLSQYAHEVEAPGLADIVVYKFGRTFSHVGIITGPDTLIHAFIDERKVTAGLSDGGRLAGRERKFFSVWSEQ